MSAENGVGVDKVHRFKGVPVPWVARWTSEVIRPGPEMVPARDHEGRVSLSFVGELPEDRIDGVLYMREGDSAGVGEPLFKQVHTHRQRLCMVECRCQVCGDPIEGKPVWILPKGAPVDRVGRFLQTETPPVCRACIEPALALCPHLSAEPFTVMEVGHHRAWGLFGDVVVPVHGTMKLSHFQATLPLNGYLGNIVGRQVIVELLDYRRLRR